MRVQRSSLCTHAFHHMDSKDPDIHVLDRWMLAPKTHLQRRFEPTTLHQAGQRAQHTTNQLFQALVLEIMIKSLFSCCTISGAWEYAPLSHLVFLCFLPSIVLCFNYHFSITYLFTCIYSKTFFDQHHYPRLNHVWMWLPVPWLKGDIDPKNLMIHPTEFLAGKQWRRRHTLFIVTPGLKNQHKICCVFSQEFHTSNIMFCHWNY